MNIRRIVTFIATSGAAATLITSAASAATSTADQNRLTTLKNRGGQEIARRINTLKSLSNHITAAKKLTDADRTALNAQVTDQITSLLVLKTKLEAETDLAAARADAQSIVTEYRVYVLVVPKIELLRFADSIQQTDEKLTALAKKLQDRITAAKTAGTDTASLQSQLDALTSLVTQAKATASSVQAAIVTLQPSDYNSDHSVLSGYRDQLKHAHDQNVQALQAAHTIITILKQRK